MTDRELQIIRYADGIMNDAERTRFEADLSSDDLLRSEIFTERTIIERLRASAAQLEADPDFSSVPGAPLRTPLSAASASSADNYVIYYVLGAVAIIIVGLLIYVWRGNTPTSIDRSPATTPTQTQPASQPSAPQTPAATTSAAPTERTTSPAPAAKPLEERTKPTGNTDLDKDLNAPKVFEDPKGHMPIKHR